MKYSILFLIFILFNISAITQKPLNPNQFKIVVLDGGMSGTYSGSEQKTYIRLLIYIINNSSDTLKYCGTDCLYKDIFNISKNHYLYIDNQECKAQSLVENIIPPHRSQQISLLLSEYKSPDTIINLSVSMKLYNWISGKPNNMNNKYLIGDYKDNVTIKYDKHHNEYSNKQDFDAEFQKKKNMPPDLNLHILSANERKLYSLYIDPKKVSIPHDSLTYNKKKIYAFNIPVELKNNSNDTLKFLTMTCSWITDFGIDNKNIHLNDWICEANFPKEIVLPPHREFLRTLSANIDPSQLNKFIKFKVEMSLTIDNKSPGLFFNLYPFETERFNHISSNMVEVPEQSI